MFASVKRAFSPEQNIWSHFFHVSPLVLITSMSPDGHVHVAFRTQCTRIGSTNYFGFSCSPGHRLVQDVAATGEFTVNFPGPEIARQAGLSSAETDENIIDGVSAIGLTGVDAQNVRVPLIAECRAHLECRLVDMRQYGDELFIVGEVLGAAVEEDALADQGVSAIGMAPLMAFVHPGHFAGLHVARKFPFPEGQKP